MSDHKKATERYLPELSNADEGYVVICTCGHWASVYNMGVEPWMDIKALKAAAHRHFDRHIEREAQA